MWHMKSFKSPLWYASYSINIQTSIARDNWESQEEDNWSLKYICQTISTTGNCSQLLRLRGCQIWLPTSDCNFRPAYACWQSSHNLELGWYRGITNQLQREMHGITLNERKWVKKEFSIRGSSLKPGVRLRHSGAQEYYWTTSNML